MYIGMVHSEPSALKKMSDAGKISSCSECVMQRVEMDTLRKSWASLITEVKSMRTNATCMKETMEHQTIKTVRQAVELGLSNLCHTRQQYKDMRWQIDIMR